MSWLSVFEWVNFFSFDIGLALDVPSLNGTSLAFSLMTQPLLLLWFWAVEGDRLKERIEKIKFKPMEWLTKDEDKRAEWERFNLEISDGSLQEWDYDVKPFVIMLGIFPTVVLLGVALPICFRNRPQLCGKHPVRYHNARVQPRMCHGEMLRLHALQADVRYKIPR